MWKTIKMNGLMKIEKCAGEFDISLVGVLPNIKTKIKIYEDNEGVFTGYTDVKIKGKNKLFEGAIGFGKSLDEALDNTIREFMNILKEDYPESEYPNGLSHDQITYIEYPYF